MTSDPARDFDTAAQTHAGMIRQQNEDNYISRPEIGLWAVADGMGGHDAGDLASAAIVEALRSIPGSDTAIGLLHNCQKGLIEANDAIREIATARGLTVIGTTVAILLISEEHFASLWCGDSRIYLIRSGQISRITRDHSEAQELIDKGLLNETDARNWPRRNVITRAIGADEMPEVDMHHGPIYPGDIFVLCSDGLTAHLTDKEIAASASNLSAGKICSDLIELTLKRGAQDNVTVIVLRYQGGDVTRVKPT